MAVSKRLRFEILRRDGFRCRYCGLTATEAELTVDHVVPVALGGSDEASNLVCCCRDCNSGKSSSAAGADLVSQVAEDAQRWASAIATVAARSDAQIREVCGWFKPIWYGEARRQGYKKAVRLAPGTELLPDDPVDSLGRLVLTNAPRPKEWIEKVSKFLSLGLPKSVIEGHVERTMARGLPPDALWPYFCKCCWNSIQDLQEQAAQLLRDEEGND